MELDSNILRRLADYAVEAAKQAGALIESYSVGSVHVAHKDCGDSLASQVVTEVDERSQAVILEVLKPTFIAHDLALLTEELVDDGSRFEKDYFWCIDPLDGTLPFTEGKSGYAVSIALVSRAGEPLIGVVYDPVRKRLYRAVSELGVTMNGVPWELTEHRAGDELYFYTDCSFASDPTREAQMQTMETLAKQMGYRRFSVQSAGGAVCNACHVLENPPAIYMKAPKSTLGGGSFWDFAASACIFQEVGAYVRDYSGQRLELNSAHHQFFNHCGVCFCSSPKLAQRLMDQLSVQTAK